MYLSMSSSLQSSVTICGNSSSLRFGRDPSADLEHFFLLILGNLANKVYYSQICHLEIFQYRFESKKKLLKYGFEINLVNLLTWIRILISINYILWIRIRIQSIRV